jgi:HD-GYP domain-containing protein (c-di-GMP phosphodiesterase class II)
MGALLGSIRFKIAFFAFLLTMATTLLLYVVTVRITNRHISEEVVKRAEALSGNIAAAAAYSFSSKDILGLDNIVYQGKETNRDVEYIVIADTEMKTVAHSDIERIGTVLERTGGSHVAKPRDGTVIKETDGRDPILEVSTPILFLEKRLGSVIVGVNRSSLLDAQRSARRSALAVFLVTTFLGTVGSLVLSHYLTRPINELTAGVDEMIEGRRSRPLRVFSGDELGRLTESFNEMTARITAQGTRLDEFNRDLEEAYVSIVKVLAATIDARDPYTHGHSQRVSTLSLRIAREMGLAGEEIRDLEVACLFHDVGKIRTPDSILRKNGASTGR